MFDIRSFLFGGDSWPYTNLHYLNLDWILRTISRIPEAIALAVAEVETKQSIPSIIDFGAVGDGVHDDTDAFIRANNEVQSVFIPAGVYRVTPLSLKNMVFYGSESGIEYGVRTKKGSIIQCDGGHSFSNCTFENIKFYNGADQYTKSDKYFLTQDSSGCRFNKCNFYGYKGVTNYNTITSFNNCCISECTYGIYGFIDSEFTNGYIYTCDVGIYLGNGASSNRITSSKIEWCNTGIDGDTSSNNVINGCIIDRHENNGMSLTNCESWVINSLFMRGHAVNAAFTNCRNLQININSKRVTSGDSGGDLWPVTAHVKIAGGSGYTGQIATDDTAIPNVLCDTIAPYTSLTSPRGSTSQYIGMDGVYSSAWNTVHKIPIYMNPDKFNMVVAYLSGSDQTAKLLLEAGGSVTQRGTPVDGLTASYSDGVLTINLSSADSITCHYI